MVSGDVVRLKSGGNLMTVRQVDGVVPWVTCDWFERTTHHSKVFNSAMLDLVIAEPPAMRRPFYMCDTCHAMSHETGMVGQGIRCNWYFKGTCVGTFGPLNYDYTKHGG